MPSPPLPNQSNADMAFARGVSAQMEGNLGVAMEEWRSALGIAPEHEAALYHMAVALTLTKDEKGAEGMYEKILLLHPTNQNALFNLANLKMRQGRDAEAEKLYRRLTDAHSEFTAGWVNLAKVYSDRGDLKSAELMLRKALQIDPTHAIAHWNLGHLLLRLRQWDQAWREYEWRLRLPNWLKPPVEALLWSQGVPARRILLWNDQGIGDAIQFLRFPRLLAEQGHEVWVLVQDNLKTLAASAPGVTSAIGPSDPLPTFDAQAPLLSMPHRLALHDPQAAGSKPYLASGKSFSLPRNPKRLAVGLVWAGNQNFKNDEKRSVPLSSLLPLFKVEGIDFFSLQFGPAATQINEHHLSDKIQDLSPRLHDFSDTAAALEALDLVISVDTSVAHLAGALGRPCWLMLSSMPDWRWTGDKETSLWYPSLRLFQQKSAGNWLGVVSLIKDNLETLAHKKIPVSYL